MNNMSQRAVWSPSDNSQSYTQGYPGAQFYPGIQPYPVNNDFEMQKFAMRAEKMQMDIEKVREREQIETQAFIERKAKSLDLQVKHENREVQVLINYDGTPVLKNEMLFEETLSKRVADISKCCAIIYEPDIPKIQETIRRIMVIEYYDNAMGNVDMMYIDITKPDDNVYLKQIRSKGIKLLCGRRKQAEYAGKLIDGLERIAEKKILPRTRGFSIRNAKEKVDVQYIPETELTWEGIIELWI